MDCFSLKPKLTGSSYTHIFKLCQTNRRVSANKFKSFSQSFFIKQNTVIWQHWLTWLIIAFIWSFVKLPRKSIYWCFIIIISVALCFSDEYFLIAEIYDVAQDRLCIYLIGQGTTKQFGCLRTGLGSQVQDSWGALAQFPLQLWA